MLSHPYDGFAVRYVANCRDACWAMPEMIEGSGAVLIIKPNRPEEIVQAVTKLIEFLLFPGIHRNCIPMLPKTIHGK